MGTSIEWTDETWNPVRGCSRVSPGCENCYAEDTARRFSGPGLPYEGLVRIGKDGKPKAQWNGVVQVLPDLLGKPLTWRKPRMVFVNSMSDLFHEKVPFEFIAAVFGVMAASPRHTYQVLTKRPERMAEFFAWLEESQNPHRFRHPELIEHAACQAGLTSAAPRLFAAANDAAGRNTWPLPNVWLGVSVEDQASADARVPPLLDCPAAVRWVSYEPALGAVDFDLPRCDYCGKLHDSVADDGATPWCSEHEAECGYGHWLDLEYGLGWIVVGGESRRNARPFDIGWARSTIEQGRAAGVPVFVKSLGKVAMDGMEPTGEFRTGPSGRREFQVAGRRLRLKGQGGDWSEWPEDLRVREWPEAHS